MSRCRTPLTALLSSGLLSTSSQMSPQLPRVIILTAIMTLTIHLTGLTIHLIITVPISSRYYDPYYGGGYPYRSNVSRTDLEMFMIDFETGKGIRV